MRMKILHNDENILKDEILFGRFQKGCYSKVSTTLQMKEGRCMIFYGNRICAWEYRSFYSGFEVWRGKLKIISTGA